MKVMMKATAITFLALAFGGNSRAAYVVNVTESGGDVVAVGSGTINTSALSPVLAKVSSLSGLVPEDGNATFGGLGNQSSRVVVYLGFTGPQSFGTGYAAFADFDSGDLVGVTTTGFGSHLLVPLDYVSGHSLNSTSTWSGQTFASLGLTPGTYTWTWGTGADADFFTMNIGGAAVPEPSSVVMLGLGALGLIGVARRSRRTPKSAANR